MAKIGVLEQRHPEYDALAQDLADYRAIASGGREFRAHVERFLVKRAAESASVFRERVKRAAYAPLLGNLVGLLSAALRAAAEPPDGLKADEAQYKDFWEPFLADPTATESGDDFSELLADLAADALVGKRAYVLVDKPAAPKNAVLRTARDEQTLGLDRPYLVAIPAEQVIHWGEEKGRLAWAVIRHEEVYAPNVDDPLWRREIEWRYVDAARIRFWRHEETAKTRAEFLAPDALAEADAPEAAEVLHELSEIPLRRFDLGEDLWLADRVADLCKQHFNTWNALDWHLAQAAYAQPIFYTTKDMGEATGGARGESTVWRLDPNDKAEYLEPNSGAAEMLANRLHELRDEIYRVIEAMAQAISSDSRAMSGRSGYAKAQDNWGLATVLAAIGGDLRQFATSTLRLVAKARGDDAAEPAMRGFTKFEMESADAKLAQLVQAMPFLAQSPTASKEIRKRIVRVALDDLPSDLSATIDKEIDDAKDAALPGNAPFGLFSGGRAAAQADARSQAADNVSL